MRESGRLSILRLMVIIAHLGIYLAFWRVNLWLCFFTILIGNLSYLRASRFVARMQNQGTPLSERGEIWSFLTATLEALGIVLVCITTFCLPILIVGCALNWLWEMFFHEQRMVGQRGGIAVSLVLIGYLIAVSGGVAWTVRVIQEFEETRWVIRPRSSRRSPEGDS